MIIVIDTNILVGACMGSPAANEVIASCLRKDHQPIIGTTLFAEYVDVLNREELFTRCHLDSAERDTLRRASLKSGCNSSRRSDWQRPHR